LVLLSFSPGFSPVREIFNDLNRFNGFKDVAKFNATTAHDTSHHRLKRRAPIEIDTPKPLKRLIPSYYAKHRAKAAV
jgi:hypothetical protein